MNASEILAAVNAGEDKDWEFKSAKGGLPGSLWHTYSAMANTDGGVIVLGVREANSGFEIHGIDDVERMEKDLWNTINNRSKISANLCVNHDIRIVTVSGRQVLVVQVPRANRRQRPVFTGQNPLEGTYRRQNDGDYLCSRQEVGRMLADQAEQPADSEILEGFSLDDLDQPSLDQYRNRFASRSPVHPWLKADNRGLLEKLGGWRTDRTTGHEGLTVAGLLMFGKDNAIRDPSAVPQYHIDYRERLSSDPQVRWTDRVWPDGTWTANLFQFFERAYPRVVRDLRIPFQLASQQDVSLFQRHDDTIVHEAIREAFVNALIHADYRGQGGIVIERYRDRLEFSNPGTLLLGIDQILKGAVSECRNRTLQGMFAMLGYGEKAGSGIDKIRQGWASQKWRWPQIQELQRPDRVRLVLPMVSLLPEESVGRLRTASGDHPTDITRLLQDLVGKGHLVKDGYGRWASYRLSEKLVRSDRDAPGETEILQAGSQHNDGSSQHNDGSSQHNGGSSQHNGGSSQHNDGSSQHNGGSSQHNGGSSQRTDPVLDGAELLAIAAPAREKARLAPAKMRELIWQLCQIQSLTVSQLAGLLNRHPEGIRNRFLSEMVREGVLLARYPDPTHPEQAYRANPDWEEGQSRIQTPAIDP
ncbi:MAG: RNA-binding domain-containing protein [Planctomyces sp.]